MSELQNIVQSINAYTRYLKARNDAQIKSSRNQVDRLKKAGKNLFNVVDKLDEDLKELEMIKKPKQRKVQLRNSLCWSCVKFIPETGKCQEDALSDKEVMSGFTVTECKRQNPIDKSHVIEAIPVRKCSNCNFYGASTKNCCNKLMNLASFDKLPDNINKCPEFEELK